MLWLLLLSTNLCAQPASLEARLSSVEDKLAGLELSLSMFSEAGVTPHGSPMTKAELESALKIDGTGKATRKDKISDFPEISTFVAVTTGERVIVNGLAVELFHKRSAPRTSRWMYKLMLSNDWAGISVSRILIPVINFNVGPFIGLDLEDDRKGTSETVYGLQASVFSF